MSGWDGTGRWRWAKAGERRDEAEAERRRRELTAYRNRSRSSRVQDDAEARRLWEGGHLAPWRITLYLDLQGLYGPEVDRECGAEEPDVDLWEAGVLYPTWEQVVALAKLVGCTPKFLMNRRDTSVPHWDESSLRFHLPPSRECDLVERFTPEAIRDRLRPVSG